MKYEILTPWGEAYTTIIADEEFVQSAYPGLYREIPEVVVEDRIRRIRQDAFMDRFTFDEQLRMTLSPDPVVKVFKENAVIVTRPYINLDHPMVQQALPYLVANGLLDGDTVEERQLRMNEILSDGLPGEV